MGIDDNIRVLEAGMKKARELAGQMLAEKAKVTALEVCHETERDRSWTGFTGNAQTSYGTSVQSSKTFFAWGADQDNPPIIRDKIEPGEDVFLPIPYEGDPREVGGTEEIEFPNSTLALDYILDLPMPVNSLVDARLAFPVEYQDWLPETKIPPIELMHQLASVAFKTMR